MVTVLTGNTATNYPGLAVSQGVCGYSIRGEVDFALGALLAVLAEQGDTRALPGVSFETGDGGVY